MATSTETAGRQRAAATIDKELAGSPMAGLGDRFVAAGLRNGVDPFLLVAIAKTESGYGAKGFATNGSHNAFGLGVTGAAGAGNRFSTWGDGIDAAAANLSGPLYKGAGRTTIASIGSIWATAPNWASAVAGNYIGGGVSTGKVVIGAPGYPGAGTLDPVTGLPQGGGGGISPDQQPGDNIFDSIPNPLSWAVGLIKDYLPRILAFVLLGVVAVWLLGQGASKAFGTPAPGAVLSNVTPIGRAAA